jgi:hypothetical protein
MPADLHYQHQPGRPPDTEPNCSAKQVSEDSHMVVSEPLGDIPGVWNEVSEATCRIVGQGHDEQRPFHPRTS